MADLRDELQKYFGRDFHVGTGSAKQDDPLVITEQRDYVSIEYAVAKFLLMEMGFEYKFDKQRSHNVDGRIIDELVYAAKEVGDPEWAQTRRFFFDITAGYSQSYSPMTPQNPTNASSTTLQDKPVIGPDRKSPLRFALAAAVLLISALVHMFYVDYVVGVDSSGARKFLLSWNALPSQRIAYVDSLARPRVKQERTIVIQTPSKERIDELWWDHMVDYCTWRGRNRGSANHLDLSVYDFSDMKCSKPFTPPPITKTNLVVPAVDLSMARSQVEESLHGRSVKFGMTPSTDTAGNGEPSRSAMERSYWLGIMLPFVLAVFALAQLLSVFRLKRAAA